MNFKRYILFERLLKSEYWKLIEFCSLHTVMYYNETAVLNGDFRFQLTQSPILTYLFVAFIDSRTFRFCSPTRIASSCTFVFQKEGYFVA